MLCLSEPIAYFVFDNVPKTLMRFFRLAYAATFALLSFTAILMRATIFKHLSAFSGDPKVMQFFPAPCVLLHLSGLHRVRRFAVSSETG
jgi:hypothetical protein